jgi:hypothetical protein
MPLRIKPHTLKLRALDVDSDDYGRAKAATHVPEEVTILGKAEPLGAEATFKAFGVDLSEAYRVMVDLEDTDAKTGGPFLVNTLIYVQELGEYLKVAQLPTRNGASSLTSHAVILCQKTTPPGDIEEGA